MTFGTGTLRIGSTGDGVAELKHWLIDRRFLVDVPAPTGTFDDATFHAVRAFQFSAGIGVDGIVGNGTRSAADAFAATALTTGWHPSAIRSVQGDSDGGSFTTTTCRGLLHTTEGTRLPAYEGTEPHFTIGRDGAGAAVRLWQHLPITAAARALRNESGGPQTNRYGVIQVEIIGSAASMPTLGTTDPDLFRELGQWMRWVEATAGVANVANHAFDGEAAYGAAGSTRLTQAEWEASSGWLGHQHVPENTHWDPGRIDIAGLLAVPALATGGGAGASGPGPSPLSTFLEVAGTRSVQPAARPQNRIFVCNQFALGRPSGTTATAAWMMDGVPVGRGAVLDGQTVELVVSYPRVQHETVTAPRFDVTLAEYAVTQADEDFITRIDLESRQLVRQPLDPGGSLAEAVREYVRQNRTTYQGHLLVLEGDPTTYVVAWWQAAHRADRLTSEYIFRAALDDAITAQTATPLGVGAQAAGSGTVRLALRYEDNTPMANAEIEIVVGDRRVPAVTNSEGIAALDVPIQPDETFQVFLLRFPEYLKVASDGPPGPPEEVALTPEVLKGFGFDLSFPPPKMLNQLRRVPTVAAADDKIRLTVFGHTDIVGQVSYNQALSERRAAVILALLTQDVALFDQIAAQENWGFDTYQAMLWGVGCNTGPIDGDDGAMTQAAVRAFQQEYNNDVYHKGTKPRAHADLASDGDLGTKTRAALRDSYVAVAPHVALDRFSDPPTIMCSEDYPLYGDDADNRRSVVAFLHDAVPADPSADYRSLVDEMAAAPAESRFEVFRWMRTSSGVYLSCATSVSPDQPVEMTVFRDLVEVPDAAREHVILPDPVELGTVQATTRAGICTGRWQPPAGFDPFDLNDWLLDYDLDLEIFDEGDDEPGEDDPLNPDVLAELPAMAPPRFRVRSGSHEAVSPPPGVPLNRLQFAEVESGTGTALGSGGDFFSFPISEGRAGAEALDEIVSFYVANSASEIVPEREAHV